MNIGARKLVPGREFQGARSLFQTDLFAASDGLRQVA